MDLQHQRDQVHSLVDRLTPAKLDAVRNLLAVMVNGEDDDELTIADQAAIQEGLNSLDEGRGVPMEDVLADFGLTMADFEKMASER